jgi:predicted RNA binding protein YcfA (HicA-like mRNA interferase family)
MTRLPRDVSGDELAAALSRLGYQVVRQSGSHLRLTTLQGGQHHVTVPRHRALRLGTMNVTFSLVCGHFNMSRDDLIDILFK